MNRIFLLWALTVLAACKEPATGNGAPAIAMAQVIPDGVVPQVKLEGRYKINALITDAPINEYVLYPAEELDLFGNSVIFKADGSFTSAYSADCGNDCFTSSVGRYVWTNDVHVRLVADNIRITGDCQNKHYAPHKDLGVYMVVENDKDIRLIKSSGDAKADALTRSYSEAIDAFDRETSNIYNFHPIPARPGGADTTDAGKVAAALEGNPAFDPAKVKVLYSKRVRNYFEAILFEHKGQQHIVLCIVHSGYVGLYDPAKWPKGK